MCPFFKSDYRGVTLIESMVGLAIFLGTIIPVLQYLVDIAADSDLKDLQSAYTLLKGECDILYKKNLLPDSITNIEIDGKNYDLIFTSEKDSIIAPWAMHVERNGKVIAGVKGLVFLPDCIDSNKVYVY